MAGRQSIRTPGLCTGCKLNWPTKRHKVCSLKKKDCHLRSWSLWKWRVGLWNPNEMAQRERHDCIIPVWLAQISMSQWTLEKRETFILRKKNLTSSDHLRANRTKLRLWQINSPEPPSMVVYHQQYGTQKINTRIFEQEPGMWRRLADKKKVINLTKFRRYTNTFVRAKALEQVRAAKNQ